MRLNLVFGRLRKPSTVARNDNYPSFCPGGNFHTLRMSHIGFGEVFLATTQQHECSRDDESEGEASDFSKGSFS